MPQFEASNNCSYVVSIREQIFGRILCFWILQIKNLLVSLAGRIFDAHYMKEGLLMKQIMFITLAAQDEIASYAINSGNGEINEISRTHVSGRPAPVTVDTKNWLWKAGLKVKTPLALGLIDSESPSESSQRFGSTRPSQSAD